MPRQGIRWQEAKACNSGVVAALLLSCRSAGPDSPASCTSSASIHKFLKPKQLPSFRPPFRLLHKQWWFSPGKQVLPALGLGGKLLQWEWTGLGPSTGGTKDSACSTSADWAWHCDGHACVRRWT